MYLSVCLSICLFIDSFLWLFRYSFIHICIHAPTLFMYYTSLKITASMAVCRSRGRVSQVVGARKPEAETYPARMRAVPRPACSQHIHTHTHIYIYIYIFFKYKNSECIYIYEYNEHIYIYTHAYISIYMYTAHANRIANNSLNIRMAVQLSAFPYSQNRGNNKDSYGPSHWAASLRGPRTVQPRFLEGRTRRTISAQGSSTSFLPSFPLGADIEG